MSQRQKERLEQQKAQERTRKRIRTGVAATAATLALGFGFNQLANDGEVATVPEASQGAKELVHAVADETDNQGLLNILKADHKNIAELEVGRSKIRIIEVGETGEFDYEGVKQAFRHVGDYLSAEPQGGKHSVLAFDESDIIRDQFEVDSKVQAANKDITMLVLPYDFDLGSDAGEGIWSHTETGEVLSVVRSGGPADYEAAMTEVCQGLIDVVLVPEAMQKIQADKRSKVQLLAQEQVCNSLAKAMAAQKAGVGFDEYQQYWEQNSTQMFTDRYVEQGSLGYASAMPYVHDVSTYQSIGEVIPANFASLLTYPLQPGA